MLALFIPAGILAAVSLLVLSAVSFHFFILQAVWIGLGIGVIIASFFIDARSIFNARWIIWAIYGFALALMAAALVIGPRIRNTHSWLVLGPLSLQPVEFMKVALILLFANYFSRRHIAIARWKTILTSFLFFLFPALIAVKLPDLGSALIFFGIWFGFLLFLGLPWRRTLAALLVIALAGGFIWAYVLKPYHRARIIGFLYPSENTLGINYSVTQSKIAIGSGGLWGAGYGQGTQAQLGFLSEPAADFVFASAVEEWGVVGGAVILAAFFLLILQILRIGMRADENFEKFVCLGAAIALGVQFLLNTGSTTGIMPVIGVTFPLVSYGGSSMLASALMLAVVNSIRRTSELS